MSKYNNVNPGQYKTAGRERPNKAAEARLKTTRDKLTNSSERQPKRKGAKQR